MRGILLKNCNFAAEFKIIAMEFTGKIIAILPPRGGVSKTSGNEWKSQEYVIENHDQYPRKMCFDVFGADKIEQFNIQMGEELTVSFDVDAYIIEISMEKGNRAFYRCQGYCGRRKSPDQESAIWSGRIL